jgi:hypothetical protein
MSGKEGVSVPVNASLAVLSVDAWWVAVHLILSLTYGTDRHAALSANRPRLIEAAPKQHRVFWNRIEFQSKNKKYRICWQVRKLTVRERAGRALGFSLLYQRVILPCGYCAVIQLPLLVVNRPLLQIVLHLLADRPRLNILDRLPDTCLRQTPFLQFRSGRFLLWTSGKGHFLLLED